MRRGWLAVFVVAAMAEEDSFTIKRYYGGPLGPEQFYFKACLIHMPLQKEHVADGGLEFRINMETGKNTARAPVQFDVEPGSARHAEIMERQLRVIDDADERVNQGDGESVRESVRNKRTQCIVSCQQISPFFAERSESNTLNFSPLRAPA